MSWENCNSQCSLWKCNLYQVKKLECKKFIVSNEIMCSFYLKNELIIKSKISFVLVCVLHNDLWCQCYKYVFNEETTISLIALFWIHYSEDWPFSKKVRRSEIGVFLYYNFFLTGHGKTFRIWNCILSHFTFLTSVVCQAVEGMDYLNLFDHHPEPCSSVCAHAYTIFYILVTQKQIQKTNTVKKFKSIKLGHFSRHWCHFSFSYTVYLLPN